MGGPKNDNKPHWQAYGQLAMVECYTILKTHRWSEEKKKKKKYDVGFSPVDIGSL